MQPIKFGLSFLVFVMPLMLAPPVLGEVVYDIPINNEISGTARVLGQTLTAEAGDNMLDYFTIRLKGNSPATSFDFKVQAWDSVTDKRVGSPLYTSATQTVQPSGTFTDFTFTPNLTLTPGSTYIAYMDNSNYAFNNGFVLGGNFSDPYTSGAFAFLSLPSSETWIEYTNGQDVAFGARFVPEPSSLALTAFGLLLMRRRRAA
jgi:hypothetical protein